MLSSITDNLVQTYTHLRMPKFAFECEFGLRAVLSGMGMPLAFAEDADFSGINGRTEPLFLKDVLHKAIVRVDEQGTEAAAATAVVFGTTSVPPKPVDFFVDRPFLFLIRDTETGTVLFAGRVVDPVAAP
jgi:serpin B